MINALLNTNLFFRLQKNLSFAVRGMIFCVNISRTSNFGTLKKDLLLCWDETCKTMFKTERNSEGNCFGWCFVALAWSSIIRQAKVTSWPLPLTFPRGLLPPPSSTPDPAENPCAFLSPASRICLHRKKKENKDKNKKQKYPPRMESQKSSVDR